MRGGHEGRKMVTTFSTTLCLVILASFSPFGAASKSPFADSILRAYETCNNDLEYGKCVAKELRLLDESGWNKIIGDAVNSLPAEEKELVVYKLNSILELFTGKSNGGNNHSLMVQTVEKPSVFLSTFKHAFDMCSPSLREHLKNVETDKLRQFYIIGKCGTVCFIDELKLFEEADEKDEKEYYQELDRLLSLINEFDVKGYWEVKQLVVKNYIADRYNASALMERINESNLYPYFNALLKKSLKFEAAEFKKVKDNGLQTYLENDLKVLSDFIAYALSSFMKTVNETDSYRSLEASLKNLTAVLYTEPLVNEYGLHPYWKSNLGHFLEDSVDVLKMINETDVYQDVKAAIKNYTNLGSELNIDALIDQTEPFVYQMFIEKLTMSSKEHADRISFFAQMSIIPKFAHQVKIFARDWTIRLKKIDQMGLQSYLEGRLKNITRDSVESFTFVMELAKEIGLYPYLEDGVRRIATVHAGQTKLIEESHSSAQLEAVLTNLPQVLLDEIGLLGNTLKGILSTFVRKLKDPQLYVDLNVQYAGAKERCASTNGTIAKIQ